jgi:hypothetical protein
VRARTPLRELRRVGHFLREGVLERVLALGVGLRLVEQLRLDQAIEGRGELGLGQIHDGTQDRLAELGADHRRRLEHLLLALGEAIDASGQEARDGRGQRDLLHGRREPVAALRACESPRLGERDRHLLDEEGVPARALPDACGEVARRQLGPEQLAEQRVELRGAERRERDLLHVRAPRPAGPVLGPVVGDDEHARPGRELDHLLEERLARQVDPVQVLEDRHDRLAGAAGPQQAMHDRVELALADLAFHGGGRSVRVGDPQEVEEQRQTVVERAVEQQQAAGHLLARGLRRVALGDAEVVAEQLQDRKQRDGLPMRDRARDAHPHPARPAALGEFQAEPALAGARLGHHTHDLALTGEGTRERGLERGQLVGPSHEAREPARARDVEARADRATAFEHRDPQRDREPLDREGPELAQLEPARDEPCGRLRHAGRPGLGQLLHALRDPDHRALGRVVHAQVVADLADHDVARVQPHAHREREPALDAQGVGIAAQLVPQVERGVAGALCVVLVRDGRPEQRHDPVARVLVDRALEAVDPVGEDLEEAVQDAVPRLGIHRLGQLQRALHVGEQDGHLLALALERGLRREDLVHQVLRGVGERAAVRRGAVWFRHLPWARAEPVSAGEAEPCRGRELRPAACATGCERRATGEAEAGALRVLVVARDAVHVVLAAPSASSTAFASTRSRALKPSVKAA